MPFEIAYADYLPDRDTSKIPGAIADMSGFAPLERGGYGTVMKRTSATFASADTRIIGTEIVDGIDDYVFTFNLKTIERYVPSSTGAPLTKDATIWRGVSNGAHTDVDHWFTTAWGTKIIACGEEASGGGYSPLPVIASDNGATFVALTGTPPNAKFIASNVNFVMLANTDSSAQPYVDEVWWSGLQNPETWAPSIATQAGRYRLLDTPGPITALTAFKDVFVAFKNRGVYIGEYVGPPFIFNWRLINHSLGCLNNRCVARLDERLYFVTQNGLHEFDGANFRNVSGGVWKSIMHQTGVTLERVSTAPGSWPAVVTNAYVSSLGSRIAICADEVEGVIWIAIKILETASGTFKWFAWAYNARTGKWARVGVIVSDATSAQNPNWLKTSFDGIRAVAFSDNHLARHQQRAWFAVSSSSSNLLYGLSYPDTLDTDTLTAHIDTAITGRPEGSSDAVGVHVACANGSDASLFSACTLYGYANESMTVGTQQATASVNSELDRFDGRLNSRFRMARLTGADGKVGIVSGVAIESKPIGKR